MNKSLSQLQREWFERYQIARAVAAAKAGR
jgi:hypothetical protein